MSGDVMDSAVVILLYVGGILISVGGSVFMVAFTKLGERVVGHAFDEKLETFKHGLEARIEGLRAKLAVIGDRGLRSNEREFAAAIEAWEKFVEAHLLTVRVSRGFTETAEFEDAFSEFTTDEWVSYLRAKSVPDHIIERIRPETNRRVAFRRYQREKCLRDCQNAIWNARLVLSRRGIFIPSILASKIENGLSVMSLAEVQAEEDWHEGRKRPDKDSAQREFLRRSDEILTDVKNAIRIHLTSVEEATEISRLAPPAA